MLKMKNSKGAYAMEKLKDIFYNHFDGVLIILVIGTMFLVLNLRFSSLFEINMEKQLLASIDVSAQLEEARDSGKIEEEAVQPVDQPNEPEIIDAMGLVNLEIPMGVTSYDIADQLLEHGIIEDTSIFIDRLIELNITDRLNYGTYELSPTMDIDEIIDAMSKNAASIAKESLGTGTPVKISIPSGSSGDTIASILQDQGLIEKKQDFIQTAISMKLDRYLLSGTYTLNKGMDLEEIVKIIAHRD
jgi:cell division protein YceG involved in septum cleavage